ncbi:MAG: EAL domain-containing protein [Chromatiaceae bacterium]|nr:EAL domain-containing protein [Chromatiaceae bacterium]
MRVSLWKKVFASFSSLFAVTLALALWLAYGLNVLHDSRHALRLLSDFRVQLRALQNLHPPTPQESDLFEHADMETELARAGALVDRLLALSPPLDAQRRASLLSVRATLASYGRFYDELSERYKVDRAFPEATFAFFSGYWLQGVTKVHAPEVEARLDRVLWLCNRWYHERNPAWIAELRVQAAELGPLMADEDARVKLLDLVQQAERNADNYQTIRERQAELRQLLDQLARLANETIFAIEARDERDRRQLEITLYALLGLALLLTLGLWLLTAGYFRRFLAAQRQAIAAIQAGQFDYPMPRLADDELGDLAHFLKALALNLKSSDLELRLAASTFETHEAILMTDAEARILRVNRAFLRLTGYAETEVMGRDPQVFQASDGDPRLLARIRHALRRAGQWTGEALCLRKTGERIPVWLSVTAVLDARLDVTHYVGHVVDLSALHAQRRTIERKVAEEQVLGELLRLSLEPLALEPYLERCLATLLNALPWLSAQRSGCIFLAEELLARPASAQAPLAGMRLVAARLGAGMGSEVCQRIGLGGCLCSEAARRRKIVQVGGLGGAAALKRGCCEPSLGQYSVPIMRGERVLGVLACHLPPDHARDPAEAAFLRRVADILSMGVMHHHAETEMHFQASHDSLTRLPNRHLLLSHLGTALARARRHGHVGALLFIDLDNFKTINDSLGHPVGDCLLQEVGERLKATQRQEDTAARLGGDEFVVLLSELADDEERAAARAEQVAVKVLDSLTQPCLVGGQELHVTASMGIALFPGDARSPDDVIRKADTAMYRAKDEGRNTFRHFLPEMQAAVEERLRIQTELRRALTEDQLCLHYQPQVDQDGRLVGAEALVRWNHPERGLLGPDHFIPIAEQNGQILAMGDWVLRSACRQLAAWSASPPHSVAINVSPLQFAQDGFVDSVERVLAESGADPRRLMLEVTESVVLGSVEAAAEKMRHLRRLGIRFSLDDFGTGYSSLAYLKRLPLSELKIDRSFVRDIHHDRDDANLVETIIALASRMGLEVIAEGVESERQLRFLIESGCRGFQGYYFGRPMPVEAFEAFMEAPSCPTEPAG